MRIKITWNKTHDSLIFDCINEKVAEWFVTTAQQLGNNFSTADMITDVPLRGQDVPTLAAELSAAIDLVNSFLPKIKQPEIEKPTDWYDQQQLNKLHKDWARSRATVPDLPQALHKIDRRIFDAYNQTNCHVHLIERAFKYSFRDNKNHWRVENPFKDLAPEWQVCHLSIDYAGHGRHAFEKFEFNDTDIYTDDMCNWDNIDSFVTINLRRPYKFEPPQEFLQWCQQNGNLVPHHYDLPVANLQNWETELAQARATVINNKDVPENYFSFELM